MAELTNEQKRDLYEALLRYSREHSGFNQRLSCEEVTDLCILALEALNTRETALTTEEASGLAAIVDYWLSDGGTLTHSLKSAKTKLHLQKNRVGGRYSEC